jgi:RHS repeat-associated protein
VAAYTYDPYGKLVAKTGTADTSLQYTGQYTDTETGLTYLRNRYYDPTTTQFLTRDPAVAITGSAYGYVEDNPLSESDPAGLYPGQGIVNQISQVISCITENASRLGGCQTGARPAATVVQGTAAAVRTPDYITIDAGNVGLPMPVIGPFLGWDVNVTVTKPGHVYFGGGGAAGTPGPFGSLRGGWINGSNHPSDCTIDSFNDHWGTTVSGQVAIPGLPVGPSVGRTYGGNGTWSNEAGVGVLSSAGASRVWSGRLPFDLW